MMEIRWVIRPGWDGPEKVLQVRYKHDDQWSEWKDVPEVDLMRTNK